MLPFIFEVMWAFIMCEFRLGKDYYIITFMIAAELLLMLCGVVFGMLRGLKKWL